MAGYPQWQDEDDDVDGAVGIVDHEEILKPPSLYKVIFLNDDFTPVTYVVKVLQYFFNKTEQEATILAQEIHQKGKGVAGIYTYDVATTKAVIVNQNAQQHDFPLKVVTEAE